MCSLHFILPLDNKSLFYNYFWRKKSRWQWGGGGEREVSPGRGRMGRKERVKRGREEGGEGGRVEGTERGR